MLCRLKHALLANNINLYYQPIYSACTKKIVGFEALLRWRDARFGRVCPETLIGLAVENGLMSTVSLYVIKKAIAEMATLLARHGLLLNLNITPGDLNSISFKNTLLNELARHQLNASSIVLEITEVSCNDTQALMTNATQFRQHGFHLALDDFGKGCSNHERLLSLLVTDVKIDKSLTQALCAKTLHGEKTLRMCRALYERPYRLIFEGIEFAEQLACITREFPGARAQGWYFSKALPIEGVRALLNEASPEAVIQRLA